MNVTHKPNEGDIYKIINICGIEFVLRYGFYSESERELGEPIPILPNFNETPFFTENGMPLVTCIQDACKHYCPKNGTGDGWCADCIYFPNECDEIGICQSEKNKKI